MEVTISEKMGTPICIECNKPDPEPVITTWGIK